MGYITKVTFADLQDGKRLYLAGSKYPRDGFTVTNERLKQLSSSDNLMGYPLIEFVDDGPAEDVEQKEQEELAEEIAEEHAEQPVVKRRTRKNATTGL